jgi:hypothetical protein
MHSDLKIKSPSENLQTLNSELALKKEKYSVFSTCNTAEASAKVGPPDSESRKETFIKRAEQEMLEVQSKSSYTLFGAQSQESMMLWWRAVWRA